MPTYPRIGLIAFLNTADFVRGMSVYTSGLAAITTKTYATGQTLNQGFVSMGDGVLRMARNAALAVTIIGAAAIGVGTKLVFDAAKASIAAETAFAGVVKTAGNLTSSYGVLNVAGKELKATLLEMSTIKPITFAGLSEIAMVGAQAGLPSGILAPFTDMIADLVSATGMNTENAATRLAQFINIMGILDEEAGDPVENIQSLGAAIADLGNKFPGTEAETIVLAQRIAGMGQAVGMATQDVLALAAAMIAVGVRSEAGGTAAQRVLMAMADAVAGAGGTGIIDNTAKMAASQEKILDLEEKIAIKRQQIAEQTDKTALSTSMSREKALSDLESDLASEQALLEGAAASHGKTAQEMAGKLQQFAKLAGVSAGEFSAIWREDPGEAVRLFVLGLAAAGDRAGGILKALGLGDARLIRSFLQLAGAGDLITETMQVSSIAWEQQTALVNEAAERYATIDSIFQMLKNRFTAVQIGVGDTLRPAIKQIIKIFGSLEAPGKKLIALFEKRIGPALEDVAVGFRLLTMGDVEGMWSAFKSALIKAFGADTTIIVWNFVTEVREALTTISDWVEDNRPILEGAIKGISVLLAAAGFAAIIRNIAGVLGMLLTPIGLLTLAMAGFGIAWETNWNDLQAHTRRIISELGPEILAFKDSLVNLFSASTIGEIRAKDWETVGAKIWTAVNAGIALAQEASLSFDELLRNWAGTALKIQPQLEKGLSGLPSDVIANYLPETVTWGAIGEEIGFQLKRGIISALGFSEYPSINSALADTLGSDTKITDWLDLADSIVWALVQRLETWVNEHQEEIASVGRNLANAILGGLRELNIAGEESELFSTFLSIGDTAGRAFLQGFGGAIDKAGEEWLRSQGPFGEWIAEQLIKRKGRIENPEEILPFWERKPEDNEGVLTKLWTEAILRGLPAGPGLYPERPYETRVNEDEMGFLPSNELAALQAEQARMEGPSLLDRINTWLQEPVVETLGRNLEQGLGPLWVNAGSVIQRSFNTPLYESLLILPSFNAQVQELSSQLGLTGLYLTGFFDNLTVSVLTFKRWMEDLTKTQPTAPASESNYGPLREFASGGWVNAMVGERGREMVSMPAGSYVHNNRMTERMMGSNMTVQVFIEGGSADMRYEAEIGVKAGLGQFGIKVVT